MKSVTITGAITRGVGPNKPIGKEWVDKMSKITDKQIKKENQV